MGLMDINELGDRVQFALQQGRSLYGEVPCRRGQGQEGRGVPAW